MDLIMYKTTSSGSYKKFPTPSTYKISAEDLDNNSYRSINSGNLIDNVISKAWSKLELNYNCVDRNTAKTIATILLNNPVYIKAIDPALGTDTIEMQMRCSKKTFEMLENGDFRISFNLVQKKKVSGQ